MLEIKNTMTLNRIINGIIHKTLLHCEDVNKSNQGMCPINMTDVSS